SCSPGRSSCTPPIGLSRASDGAVSLRPHDPLALGSRVQGNTIPLAEIGPTYLDWVVVQFVVVTLRVTHSSREYEGYIVKLGHHPPLRRTVPNAPRSRATPRTCRTRATRCP